MGGGRRVEGPGAGRSWEEGRESEPRTVACGVCVSLCFELSNFQIRRSSLGTGNMGLHDTWVIPRLLPNLGPPRALLVLQHEGHTVP